MKFVLIHNEYRKPSGEEVFVENVRRVLEEHGHEVIPFSRSSAEIPTMAFGKVRAFFSGIYSRSSRKAMRRVLSRHQPDLALVHNVFPLISPSVLLECRRAGVPVVMSINNYRLMCPGGLFLTRGEICEKCAGGREYWCVLRNCERNLFKSIGYALRNYVARRGRMFADNVTLYATSTEFARQKLIAAGFPAERIITVPNIVKSTEPADDVPGDYVGYIGRISPEKGVHVLVDAARKSPGVSFKATGSTTRMPRLPDEAPQNFEFVGFVDEQELERFYARSRLIVMCTLCYEGFGQVSAEAMMRGKPVIASRIGGMAEIVDDGVTGLLFEPGDADELAEKVRTLWEQPGLCRRMGRAGREKALREYTHEAYYDRLMEACRKAVALGPGGSADSECPP